MKIKGGFAGAFLVSLLISASFSAAQDAAEYPGTVVKKTGATVTIKMEGSPALNAGIQVSVYKFFTKEILGMQTSGWLHAAEARLIGLDGDTATVKITEEKSKMTVNNKKVEHLTAGTKVKLVLKR